MDASISISRSKCKTTAAPHAGKSDIIPADGVVKVLDFGIARRAGAVSAEDTAGAPSPSDVDAMAPTQMTMDGAISGTPGYMAPEQLTRGASDAHSDQFAWGVLAYEVLSGRLPWSSSDAADLMRSVLSRAPAPLSTAELGVSESVTTAVLRALEKDPARRFPSMDELLAALDVPSPRPFAQPVKQGEIDPEAPTLLEASTPEIQPQTPAIPTPSPSRRLRFGLVAAVVLAAAVGVVVKLRTSDPAAPASTIAILSATPRAISIPAPRDAQRVTLDAPRRRRAELFA
jgi:serine/threonine-protein kinase